MRILIIRNYPTFMNVKNQSYNIQETGLAKAIVRKGHQCDVVFWTDKQDEQVKLEAAPGKYVTVYYIKAKRILKNGVFPKRLDDLADKYDIIQVSEYNQSQAWLYAGRFHNKAVVLHGPYYAKFNKKYNLLCAVFDMFFLRRYQKLGTQFMVKSKLAEDFLLSKKIKPENISRVYVGIDEQLLLSAAGSERSEFIEKLNNEPSKLLLYIGRLEPRRKSIFLLDVFHEVLKECPDTKLVVVGDGTEEYKEKFKAHMKELQIEDKVYWTQRLEQKYLSRLYEKVELFLLPTEMEIFGMVLLEAMYFSTPAITSYNGGSSTLIKNGENGIYTKTFDLNLWTDIVVKLLKDDNKRKKMGEAAKETIVNDFTWDKISERFLNAYTKKLEGQKHD